MNTIVVFILIYRFGASIITVDNIASEQECIRLKAAITITDPNDWPSSFTAMCQRVTKAK